MRSVHKLNAGNAVPSIVIIGHVTNRNLSRFEHFLFCCPNEEVVLLASPPAIRRIAHQTKFVGTVRRTAILRTQPWPFS
jgi:hypothetical protein